MPSLRVIPDLEQVGFKDGSYKVKQQMGEVIVGGMPRGTVSERPTVMIAFEQGGNYLVGETTLALFLTAADALKAKYGDPRQ